MNVNLRLMITYTSDRSGTGSHYCRLSSFFLDLLSPSFEEITSRLS